MTSIEVITPTFNRLEPLRRTLAGLASQSHRQFTVLIVDDCSTVPVEDTVNAQDYPFEVHFLRTGRNSGPAAARNLGVRFSTASIIAFVDDDVVPDRALLETHLSSLLSNGQTSVSIGPLRAPGDWKPTPWNRWEAQTIAAEYRKMARGEYAPTWRQFFTGNAMLRRQAFLEAGGFNESFKRAEDIEFAYRLAQRGAKFVFEPRAVGWHYAERSLSSWRRIPVQYAEFDLAIDEMYPELRWSSLIERETARRHPATRAVDGFAAKTSAERAVSTLAIGAARAAHGFGLHCVSNRLLSLAFQMEYGRRRRELLQGHRFNAPSTAVR